MVVNHSMESHFFKSFYFLMIRPLKGNTTADEELGAVGGGGGGGGLGCAKGAETGDLAGGLGRFLKTRKLMWFTSNL